MTFRLRISVCNTVCTIEKLAEHDIHHLIRSESIRLAHVLKVGVARSGDGIRMGMVRSGDGTLSFQRFEGPVVLIAGAGCDCLDSLSLIFFYLFRF